MNFNLINDQTDKYNLQSIIMHVGGCNGGHYYTYVKDFSTNTWIKFDDKKTTRDVRIIYTVELIHFKIFMLRHLNVVFQNIYFIIRIVT